MSEVLAEQARLMPFILGVIASGWRGGLAPGILATILGALLGVFLIVLPTNSFEMTIVADGVNLAIFILTGLIISWVFEAVHVARRCKAAGSGGRLQKPTPATFRNLRRW